MFRLCVQVLIFYAKQTTDFSAGLVNNFYFNWQQQQKQQQRPAIYHKRMES